MSKKVSSALLTKIVHVGGGCSISHLGDTLRALQVSRPLIVTDQYLLKSGAVDKLLSGISGVDVGVWAETQPEPTVGCVEKAARVAAEGKYDSCIGFGGGSPMDTAKAVAVVAGVPDGVEKLPSWKVPSQPPPGLPVICIPTTSGTGSEATRVFILTHSGTKEDGTPYSEKMLFLGENLQPAAALVDYEWTMTMPFRLTADTGIDALCHCIEAYTSRKANFLSDSLALRGINTLYANIRKACFEPGNADAREHMALGSLLGGKAFSNSSVHMIHGMSRPIGAHFGVPHGLSNAMLLPSVTRFATEAPVAGDEAHWGGDFKHTIDRYAEVAHAMGSPASNHRNDCLWLSDTIAKLNLELKVPSPLDFVGGEKEKEWFSKRELMAEQALASGSPGNCPRTPDKERIVEMYGKLWASAA
eukprot:Hpha_TRINITY_DN1992_c0_g1::TRINITY_DN1992_c0_g1_i1::g.31138::m.31138